MKPSDERPATGRGGGSGVGGDAATSGGGGLPANVEALAAKLLAIPPDRASPQAVVHLQKLIVFLRETLLDRNLAIVHQRKTNQILGKKVTILTLAVCKETRYLRPDRLHLKTFYVDAILLYI